MITKADLLQLEAAPARDVDEPVDGQPWQQVEAVATTDEPGNLQGGRDLIADELDVLGKDVRSVVSEAVGLTLL